MRNKYEPLEWNDDLEQQLFSPEEIEQNRLEAEFIRELTAARNAMRLTQKELEMLSGVKQSAIARLERGTASPNVKTLIKLLRPLGKTLAIVPAGEQIASHRVAEPC